ncbi:MAG TPA: fibronectin type III domain-containing protein [Deltaproteobacteria bacterium]|nr:fibronectin type III domain-containing protein [Deltaproteobacteria bacterium]HPP81252.1 fibronectin type III domain-containing protein [Deltaproteobacteria bacterium]
MRRLVVFFTMVFMGITAMVFLPQADLDAASLLVTWNRNPETDIAGYRVYYGTRSGAFDHVAKAGNATSHTIQNVATGVTYYVAVSAYDTSGNESPRSATLSVYVPSTSPSQPSGSTGSTQATNPAGAATSNPSSSVASSGDTSPNQSADPDPGDADDTQSPPETLPRPVVVSPLDNEADVELTPLLEATPPPGDHWYGQWEISSASGDLVLAATVASPTDGFQVPDLVLEGGTEYYCRVRYHDGSGTYTEWSEPTLFITARDDTEDLDGNGVPDDQEPPAGARVDLDRNGVSDLVQEGMLTILTTEGGMPLSLKASTNCRGIKVFKALDTARGEGFETKPAYLPIGIVDFKMELDRPGDLAEVIVYLPRKAPVGSKWYFFDQRNGWREYPHAVLSEDRLSVTLTLKDGDPDYGDSDGAANGVIVDPGGLGVDGEAASFDESPRDQHLGCFVTATDTDRGMPGANTPSWHLIAGMLLAVCTALGARRGRASLATRGMRGSSSRSTAGS